MDGLEQRTKRRVDRVYRPKFPRCPDCQTAIYEFVQKRTVYPLSVPLPQEFREIELLIDISGVSETL